MFEVQEILNALIGLHTAWNDLSANDRDDWVIMLAAASRLAIAKQQRLEDDK